MATRNTSGHMRGTTRQDLGSILKIYMGGGFYFKFNLPIGNNLLYVLLQDPEKEDSIEIKYLFEDFN